MGEWGLHFKFMITLLENKMILYIINKINEIINKKRIINSKMRKS
jgi:hypothetical protein